MNCDPLAATGNATDFTPLIAIARVCLVAGIAVVLIARRRRRGMLVTAILAVLIVGASAGAVSAAPAHAANSDCASAQSALTVTQTSIMDGLAPGVAPSSISGLVTNRSPDSTFIAAVRVDIIGVTRSVDAPAGTCTASDYRIADAVMPVGVTLEPGGSTSFTGASIGFASTSANQDACKNAFIHLLYTANPR